MRPFCSYCCIGALGSLRLQFGCAESGVVVVPVASGVVQAPVVGSGLHVVVPCSGACAGGVIAALGSGCGVGLGLGAEFWLSVLFCWELLCWPEFTAGFSFLGKGTITGAVLGEVKNWLKEPCLTSFCVFLLCLTVLPPEVTIKLSATKLKASKIIFFIGSPRTKNFFRYYLLYLMRFIGIKNRLIPKPDAAVMRACAQFM